MAHLDLTEKIVGADRALFSRWAGAHNRPEYAAATFVRPARDPIGAIVRIGCLVALGGLVVQTVLHVIGLTAFDTRPAFLDLDDDESLFTWVTGVVTFAGALGCVLLASVAPPHRSRLLVLAGLLAFLSLDDVLAVHERVRDDTFGLDPDLEAGRVIWPIVFLPVLAATAALLWTVARESPLRVAAVIRIGLLFLVLAVGLEAASVGLFPFDWGPKSKPYETEVVLEEGFELVGVTLIAAGLIALAYTGLVRVGERAPVRE